MLDQKSQQSLNNLANALSRLNEACQEPQENKLAIDGTIQRFEFVIELFWKTLKRLLFLEGIEVYTPKESLQKAYEFAWLQNEDIWLSMLKDRNETSHIYNEAKAKLIYQNIQVYLPELQKTYNFLVEHFSQSS